MGRTALLMVAACIAGWAIFSMLAASGDEAAEAQDLQPEADEVAQPPANDPADGVASAEGAQTEPDPAPVADGGRDRVPPPPSVPEGGAAEEPAQDASTRPPTLPAEDELEDREAWARVRVPEGARERVLYRHPRQIAEFGAKGDPRPPVRDARLARDQAGIRIWQLPDAVEASDVLSERARAEPNRVLSPLYFANRSHHGTPLLSPGGITVQFRSDWTRAQVDAFAKTHGLSGTKPLSIGTSWYGFSSAPGDGALRLAARIHKTGEVVLAKPDWQQETGRR